MPDKSRGATLTIFAMAAWLLYRRKANLA